MSATPRLSPLRKASTLAVLPPLALILLSAPRVHAQTANFGAVSVAGSATQTLTFTFDANATIGAPAVLTQGAPGLDFTDADTGTPAPGNH